MCTCWGCSACGRQMTALRRQRPSNAPGGARLQQSAGPAFASVWRWRRLGERGCHGLVLWRHRLAGLQVWFWHKIVRSLRPSVCIAPAMVQIRRADTADQPSGGSVQHLCGCRWCKVPRIPCGCRLSNRWVIHVPKFSAQDIPAATNQCQQCERIHRCYRLLERTGAAAGLAAGSREPVIHIIHGLEFPLASDCAA